MTAFTATYSPDDNKLRLHASSRLDPETYAKVKAAGFRWAPKQELFVAPAWTPAREDLLIELAGEITDEDTSLIDRAEERAERFEEYHDKRLDEAERAREAVSEIADNIPLGQPILVGHHSERHARRDAERIRSGMERAVRLWDTANYWKARAAGALRHAKHKELPAVRHRRIKGIESDKRKAVRGKADCERRLKAWSLLAPDIEPEIRLATALRIANDLHEGSVVLPDGSEHWSAWSALKDGKITVDEVQQQRLARLPGHIVHWERWIAHYDNRLAYERAMLGEQIGTEGELGSGMGGRFDVKAGGQVLVRGEWLTVLRVNKSGNVVNSVTVTPPSAVHWTKKWKYGIENVLDYKPPTEERAAAVAKATKQPPICNYPSEGCQEMTEAEWKQLVKRKWSDFPYYGVVAASAAAGRHRVRQRPGPSLSKVRVFITDAKRIDPPKPEQAGETDAA